MPSSANPGAANPGAARTSAAKTSASTRPLPGRPSLRYLKLEAKRRLADGEFTTLHEAQLAIAREHGFSSWTVLKEHITAAETASSRPSGG